MAQEQFALPSVQATTPTYADIIKMLQAPRATQTQALPQIQEVLGEKSKFLEPQVGALSADIQGAMGKRGLTGSSIEAQAIAEGTGGMRAGFAAQSADLFAQLIARAQAGDVDAQRQMMIAIAQAMGQELTDYRSQKMFDYEMAAAQEAGEQRRKAGIAKRKYGLVKEGVKAVGRAYGGYLGSQKADQLAQERVGTGGGHEPRATEVY